MMNHQRLLLCFGCPPCVCVCVCVWHLFPLILTGTLETAFVCVCVCVCLTNLVLLDCLVRAGSDQEKHFLQIPVQGTYKNRVYTLNIFRTLICYKYSKTIAFYKNTKQPFKRNTCVKATTTAMPYAKRKQKKQYSLREERPPASNTHASGLIS